MSIHLNPSGSLLTLDPPAKQFILHIFDLCSNPRPVSIKKSDVLYYSSRMHLLVEFISTNESAFKAVQQMSDPNSFIDGQASGLQPPSESLPQVNELFSFVLDDFPTSNTHLLVSQYAVAGLNKIVEEWIESNVFTRADQEAEDDKKAKMKRKR